MDFLCRSNYLQNLLPLKNEEVRQRMESVISVKYCNYCGTISEHIQHCSRCKSVHYCNVECQKKDWPNHKSGCVLAVNKE